MLEDTGHLIVSVISIPHAQECFPSTETPGFAELSCSGAKPVDLGWNLQKQFLSPLSLGNLRECYNMNE